MIRYSLWLLITSALSVFVLIQFWPVYEGNEFPLFTDITSILLFLPAFFVLFFGAVSQIVIAFLPKGRARSVLLVVLFVAVYVFSLGFLEYSLLTRIVFSTLAASLGFLHFVLSTTLYIKKA